MSKPPKLIENTQGNIQKGYQIKLIVSIEKNKKFMYKNEFIVPKLYDHIKEVQFCILMDIEYRLGNTMYFRSPKKGYDLVCYSKEASVNTYLSYRVFPVFK